MNIAHVDPAACRMWSRHNRAYGLLTQRNCADLIAAIRDQGRQVVPAIARPTGDPATPYEVVCGARRHFAVAHLRADGLPDLAYVVDVRDLDDEAAFRLSDVENRTRADLSEFERARDYAQALDLYYGGSQAAMADRLDISRAWLSRLMVLARLPAPVVGAFPNALDLTEKHARQLRPLLRDAARAEAVLREAVAIVAEKRAGAVLCKDAASTMARLRKAVPPPKPRTSRPTRFSRMPDGPGIAVSHHGRKVRVEFDAGLGQMDLDWALRRFVAHRFRAG